MNERTRAFLIYILKCVIGTIAFFIIASVVHAKNMAWSLISLLLVLSPEGRDAVSVALLRIKANLIGAVAGLLCLLIASPNMWTITLGISVTLFICYLLKLDSAARTALAGMVIVMLRPEGTYLWNAAIERVIAVLVGSALGLIITFIFHLAYKPATETKTDAESSEP